MWVWACSSSWDPFTAVCSRQLSQCLHPCAYVWDKELGNWHLHHSISQSLASRSWYITLSDFLSLWWNILWCVFLRVSVWDPDLVIHYNSWLNSISLTGCSSLLMSSVHATVIFLCIVQIHLNSLYQCVVENTSKHCEMCYYCELYWLERGWVFHHFKSTSLGTK